MSRVVVKRDELGRFIKGLAKANEHKKVEVGVFGSKGGESKKGNDKLTVLEVAIFHEFGLGVPERSFIRGYVDENKSRIQEMCKALALRVFKGEVTMEDALELLGLKIQGEIVKRISDGIPPPNAPSTVKGKGSSTPLVDTGQLRSSISYRVV